VRNHYWSYHVIFQGAAHNRSRAASTPELSQQCFKFRAKQSLCTFLVEQEKEIIFSFYTLAIKVSRALSWRSGSDHENTENCCTLPKIRSQLRLEVCSRFRDARKPHPGVDGIHCVLDITDFTGFQL
jgi:hypothetical protein